MQENEKEEKGEEAYKTSTVNTTYIDSCPILFAELLESDLETDSTSRNDAANLELYGRFFYQPQILTSHQKNSFADKHADIDTGFLKGAQISPNGQQILLSAESGAVHSVQVVNFNKDLLDNTTYYSNTTASQGLNPVSKSEAMVLFSNLNVGESVYDMKWYPLIDTSASSYFITTTRDHPIHLWNANESVIKGTYAGYDHVDELDASVSVCFNLHGDKIYAGSNRMIRCFDVNRPGREYQSIPTCKTRKSLMGQKGLIAAISFNPDYSGAYAASSYAFNISVYVENEKESVLSLPNLPMSSTHLRWSPCGRYLWAGGRSSHEIHCFDLRQTRTSVGTVTRNLETNQRMIFDMDPWGKFLCTGSQDGELLIYNTQTCELVHLQGSETVYNLNIQCTDLCLNTALFHPFSGLICTVFGERYFKNYDDITSFNRNRSYQESIDDSSKASYLEDLDVKENSIISRVELVRLKHDCLPW